MISMTKSAETLTPLANTAASGNALTSVSTILAGGPSGPVDRSSGRSTTMRSGRRAPPSWTACGTRRNSPTSNVVGLSPSSRRTGESVLPTKIVRSASVIWAPRSLGGPVALAERLGHALAHARDARYQGEVLLFLGPQIHQTTSVGPGPRGVGLDELDGHHEQELGLVVLEAGAAEERAQDRDVAQHRDLRDGLPDIVVEEA